MDYASLPHFSRREGSGSSKHWGNGTTDNCFSLDHAFHQELYDYIKEQCVGPTRQGSFHVDFPETEPDVETVESQFYKFGKRNGLSSSLNNLKIDAD